MLDGFYVIKGDGLTQYTRSFSRRALNALFSALAVSKVGTTPVLTLGIEHKNRDDTAFVSAGSFGAISASSTSTPYTEVISGLREEVRFSFSISATNAWEGYLLRILAPAWFN